MKVYFLTLGCRVNQYETDAIRNLFIEKGHQITDDPSDADCCIVNTCSVTGEADRKSRQSLRKMARLNPGSVVVAMGCASELADGVLDCDIALGTRDKNQVVKRVEEFISKRGEKINHRTTHIRPELSKKDTFHDFGTVLSPEGTRAYIKIEDGCNMFCTYCIIPFARGRVCSRPFDDIVAEAKSLAQSGFKEVVITGIHTCSYGKDRGEDIMSLYRVLSAINDIDGIVNIRLASLEPMSLTDEFIKALGTVTKLCPQFHLSLQSGSDTVLARMKRRYDTAQYKSRAEAMRRVFPDMALTTDVIAGFPGETEEEFAETCEFVRRMKFAKLHVFPYSVREGTAAAEMPGQLTQQVKKQRAGELIRISSELEAGFARTLDGKTGRMIVEKVNGTHLTGWTQWHVGASADMAGLSQGDVAEGVIRVSGDEVILTNKCSFPVDT
ncbi:MAG: tRNA (N(6)-L-threonylcarbamoyladenosine(37)-C(2))-methylthiotransferase MtaB [Clostridiales bacterium]|nr:tRNA (N(6)-L-threonylcarbamoyladenosine(37)-C(2))-methylthiotransferase MtaB [Clostridiales bacterium]